MKSMTRTIGALLFALSAMLAALPAYAASSIELTPEQTAAITRISDFINGFKSLQGEFTQTGPRGTVSKGTFYLSKPGKMRFEYAAPNPFIIVSDGNWVTIKNRAKEAADQYPLSQTPLRLVLSDRVNILKEANILDIDDNDRSTTVTLEDRKKLVPGYLILVYDKGSKALQQWIVVDGKGRRTTVALDHVVAGVDADPKLFIIAVKRSSGARKD